MFSPPQAGTLTHVRVDYLEMHVNAQLLSTILDPCFSTSSALSTIHCSEVQWLVASLGVKMESVVGSDDFYIADEDPTTRIESTAIALRCDESPIGQCYCD